MTGVGVDYGSVLSIIEISEHSQGHLIGQQGLGVVFLLEVEVALGFELAPLFDWEWDLS